MLHMKTHDRFMLRFQGHGNTDERSPVGPYGDIINDLSWESNFPHHLTAFPEPTSQNHFAYFPSTVEDEERMIMEAIAASLQVTDISDRQANQNNTSNVETVSSHPAMMPPDSVLSHPASMPPEGSLSLRLADNAIQGAVDGRNTSQEDVDIERKAEEQPATSVVQTVGTLEALGQRWGLGLFRAMSSKQSNNGR
ncbi:hypothetical protein L7F22_017560 [Adiantum nelumboides]|nr:hypothetical protein [Adiantum nelumboides]